MSSIFADIANDPSPTSIGSILADPDFGEVAVREWRELVGNEARCLRAAAGAYRHPNGFAKVTLFQAASGRNVRMHFWQPGHADSTPHSHRWDLMSRVVVGRLENVIYRVVDGGEYVECTALCPTTAGGSYVHTAVRKVGLRVASTHFVGAGQSYYQAFDVVHVTRVPPSEPTVTVVVTEPESTPSSTAYVKDDSRLGIIPVVPLTTDDLCSLASKWFAAV